MRSTIRSIGSGLVLAAVLASVSVGVTAASAGAQQPVLETSIPQQYWLTGGEATLETAASKVQCKTTASTTTGFYSFAAVLTQLIFKECTTTVAGIKVKCNSSGAEAGEVKTNELELLLVYIAKASSEVGVRIANGGTIASIQCGIGKVVVRGSTLAKISPINTLTTKYTLSLKGSKGLQELTHYENGAGEKVSTLLEACFGTGSECTTFSQADLSIAGLELHTASGTLIRA